MAEKGTYGIREVHQSRSVLDVHLEEISTLGYTVVSDAIDQSEAAELGHLIDQVYATQRDEVGAEILAEINDLDIARCPLVYDDHFVALAIRDPVFKLISCLLGETFILQTQNGIINRPDQPNYQANWHRDLPYQHFVCSRPLAVSALYCLDAFSTANGAIEVLPGSHKTEVFPSADYVARRATAVEAEAGSAIVFDSMLFHSSGINESVAPRRAVNHVYSAPMIRQTISLPVALEGRFAQDSRLAALFGYAYEPGSSVKEWRLRRARIVETKVSENPDFSPG